MTQSAAHHFPPVSAARTRFLSGGIVLLLHILVALALLLHVQAAKQPVLPSRSMLLLSLKPAAPAAETKAIAPTRGFAPPAVSLTSPLITVSPRGITVPEAAPPVSGSGAAVPERKNSRDLFSDEKKEEFKRFFKEQAIEDRRENAKASSHRSGCDLFRKPGELNQPDEQTPDGIPRNFVPAFGVGIHAPEDGKVYMEPCN